MGSFLVVLMGPLSSIGSPMTLMILNRGKILSYDPQYQESCKSLNFSKLLFATSITLPAKGLLAHWDGDGQAGVDDLLAAHQTFRAVHGNGANLKIDSCN